jgi:2-(1,2-epoxy-1,2-dihydrophenyl)acetyl-CoA isomerase
MTQPVTQQQAREAEPPQERAFTALRYAVGEGIATITLARPERLNALTAAMHAELRLALSSAAGDEAVKVVVLTGEGRAFSSGQDLTEDLPRDETGRIDLGPPLERDYNPLIATLAAFPKVTVAALNGPAVGASANIALACDLVVACRSATIHEAFARIGLLPDAGGTWILPRLVGPRRALAMMLMAEPVPAEAAFAMGLVTHLVEDADFPAAVDALARKLAAGPSLAYRLTKQAVAASLVNDLTAQLALEKELQREAGFSDDFLEGIAAFKAKRPPRFTGR